MNGRQGRADAAVQEAFSAAVRNHQAGRLHEAIRLYGEVRAASPRHADSLHLLGVVASQMGRHGLAVDLINQAIAINDAVTSYHSSLGNALAVQGSLDDTPPSLSRDWTTVIDRVVKGLTRSSMGR
jgi:protein O-GlcNAc transferase